MELAHQSNLNRYSWSEWEMQETRLDLKTGVPNPNRRSHSNRDLDLSQKRGLMEIFVKIFRFIADKFFYRAATPLCVKFDE